VQHSYNQESKEEAEMAINETATGNDSVAITGTASASERTIGVKGVGDSTGVHGEGKAWNGVEGVSQSTIGGSGVFGANTAGGNAVAGVSTGGMGVYGKSESTTGGAGVMGEAVGTGVLGKSQTWMVVHGETQSTTGGAGVSGRSVHPDGTVNQDGVAGFFDGKVVVTNDIILSNADCAEDFNIGTDLLVEPGTSWCWVRKTHFIPVSMPITNVWRALSLEPAITNQVSSSINSSPRSDRKPIALLGKAYCKVDAQYGPVPAKAFGAVIGKALRPLKEGKGLIPILIALQ
jgi:hypothetical protein